MLVKNNWNVSKTAEEIGFSRRNLHEKINQFQLNRGDSMIVGGSDQVLIVVLFYF